MPGLIGFLNYVIYYIICEKLFRGYCLGAYHGHLGLFARTEMSLTLKDVFFRSLIRMIPFGLFSGFSALIPHDDRTDTKVIKAG